MATAKKKATKAGVKRSEPAAKGSTKKAAVKREPTAKKAPKKKTTKAEPVEKKTAKAEPAAKKVPKKKTTKAEPAAKKAPKKKTAKAEPVAKKTAVKKTAKEVSTGQLPGISDLVRIRDELRAYAFSLPGAWEDHPWGESVAKVGKKVFVFFGTSNPVHEGIGMSVKLPYSGDLVLALPFAEPTGYGLGKAGWVSVVLQPAEAPPMPMLTSWIDESYRAVAPKRQVAELNSRRP